MLLCRLLLLLLLLLLRILARLLWAHRAPGSPDAARLVHPHHSHPLLLLLLLHVRHLLSIHWQSLAAGHSLLLDHDHSLVGPDPWHHLLLTLHHLWRTSLLVALARVHTHGRSALTLWASWHHVGRHPLILLQHHHPRLLTRRTLWHPRSHDTPGSHYMGSTHGRSGTGLSVMERLSSGW